MSSGSRPEDRNETERIERLKQDAEDAKYASREASAHSIYHSLLRSQAVCRECGYQAPMDGPDRIAAAIDRLTAAIDSFNTKAGDKP